MNLLMLQVPLNMVSETFQDRIQRILQHGSMMVKSFDCFTAICMGRRVAKLSQFTFTSSSVPQKCCGLMLSLEMVA